ncbi:MAG TPA: 5'-methylthioadenosine/adenosylhomocysteine nucleosidase [Vicinamibacterales bacterium]|nr:5'-methylthioadenosine/adenosylhomocysteine nucleosidase [Vicinamibacterales bacterium]
MCWKNVPVSLRSGGVEPRGRRVLRRLFITLGLVAVIGAAPGTQQLSGRVVAVIGITREIAPVEARLQSPTIERIRDVVFTSGTIDGARIMTARVGVGKVNAAEATTLLLDHFVPAAVIFSGTAGAVDPDLNPGDVVIGTAVGHHDFGTVTAGAFVRGPTRDPASGQVDPAFFPADPELLAAARRAAVTLKPSRLPDADPGPVARISEGVIVTGDAFISSSERRDELRSELKASVVEMEGAAVAQVCARFGVPLIVIRSVTDRAQAQAMPSYQRFVDLASRNAADLALATVREWQKR